MTGAAPSSAGPPAKADIPNFTRYFTLLSREEIETREKELELFIPPGPRLGDVVIERGTMEGRAGSATFYRAVNRAVLTGDPEIVDGPTVVSGDRIVLDVPEPGRRIVRVSGRRVSMARLSTLKDSKNSRAMS